jgi:CheY-like chemotaxis protein
MEDLRTLLPRGSILIVDDSTEWRAIVREILKAQPGLQLVAEACDGLDAVYKATNYILIWCSSILECRS